MKYLKKTLPYLLAGSIASGPSLARAGEVPRSQLSSPADYQTLDSLTNEMLLAEATTYSARPQANLGVQQVKKEREHWYQWLWDNPLGIATSVIILAGIGYGIYAATQKKDDKKDDGKDDGGNPGTTPPDPDAHDPDQP